MKMYLVLGFLFLYLLLIIFFYFFQRSFLYYPNEDNYLTSETINKENSIVSVETIDGLTLKSYLYMNKSNTQTVLFLHGNAGTLNSRIYKLNKFKELGFNYLALSWRGFSGNEGTPSEEGLIKDALAGLDYLNTLDIEDLKIIVYGESLGTGVGISVAGRRKIRGLILESPYTSIAELGKIKFPFLPINLILKDKYDSLKNSKEIKCPVLVMHGFEDKVVPFYMGEEIYDLIETEKLSFFTEDDHMMRFNRKMENSIKNFSNLLD